MYDHMHDMHTQTVHTTDKVRSVQCAILHIQLLNHSLVHGGCASLSYSMCGCGEICVQSVNIGSHIQITYTNIYVIRLSMKIILFPVDRPGG